MKNLQGNTYKYYDIIYQEWMPQEKTGSELSLLKGYIDKSGSILDLGCGSGRHLIPLHQEEYDVTGLDVVVQALELLKEKDSTANTIHSDFYQANFEDKKLTLIYMMWNAFSEFSLTKDQAKKLLEKAFTLLKDGGHLIFDISIDTEPIEHYNFSHIVSKGDLDYKLDWRLIDYDKKSNTTKCSEIVTVSDQEDKIIDKGGSIITQRWWSKEEIKEMAESAGFSTDFTTIDHSDYLYCILGK